jgi:hypothetical protein
MKDDFGEFELAYCSCGHRVSDETVSALGELMNPRRFELAHAEHIVDVAVAMVGG